MYDNPSEHGGRPNLDEILMVKFLILQAWHGLSDPEIEHQVADRISFIKFHGIPKKNNSRLQKQSDISKNTPHYHKQVKTRKPGMNSKDNKTRMAW